MEKLNYLWWELLPVKTRRIWQIFTAALLDSFYLSGWIKIGALIPPTGFLIGFLIGWFHFAPGNTYTFSIVIMGIFTLVSSFGAGVGIWLWMGYVVGDFFLFDHREAREFWTTFTRVWLPLFLSYILLFQLLVYIPLVSQSLRRLTLRRIKLNNQLVRVGEIILQAIIQAALVFVWVHTVPTLIRPLFTWWGGQPPVAAIAPLQQNGEVLVYITLIFSCVRVILEQKALDRYDLQSRAVAIQEKLDRTSSKKLHLPSWVHTVGKVAFTTFLLSGLLTEWIQAYVLAGSLLALLLVRNHFQARLQPWYNLMQRIPLLLRLIILSALNFWVAHIIIQNMWNSTNTFLPILLSVIIGIMLFSLCIPPSNAKANKKVSPKSIEHEMV